MNIAFGNNIKLCIYGSSHGDKVGMYLDGIQAGEKIDLDELQLFLNRRAPGRNEWSTSRREDDLPEIISGLVKRENCETESTVTESVMTDGNVLLTDGNRIEAVIRNTNVKSQDYEDISTVPRPAHADYPAWVKNGNIEPGGGKWSARMTAPMCIAGGIAKQILRRQGIEFKAHIYSIGKIVDEKFDLDSQVEDDFPVVSHSRGVEMCRLIADAKARKDSVGGQVECLIGGMPVGIGDALFGGIESRIAQVAFAIPAAKGIEFGAGFASGEMLGSENNDPFAIDSRTGKVITTTNNHGGILGGMSTGMPIRFKVVFKPTPSIGIEQDSVDLREMKPTKLRIEGRHDPCIVPRAVPCVEAAAAIAILDMICGCE